MSYLCEGLSLIDKGNGLLDYRKIPVSTYFAESAIAKAFIDLMTKEINTTKTLKIKTHYKIGCE